MSAWKPICDPPDEEQEVIVTVKLPGGKLTSMYSVYYKGKYICIHSCSDISSLVTHWRTLPKPYKFEYNKEE